MSDDYLSQACGLVTLKQAVEIIKVPESTIRNFIRTKLEGFPEPLQPSKKIFFKKAELVKWVLGTADPTQLSPAKNLHEEAPRKRGRPRKMAKVGGVQ